MSSVGNTPIQTNATNASSATQDSKLSRVEANLSAVGPNLGCNHPHHQGGLLLHACAQDIKPFDAAPSQYASLRDAQRDAEIKASLSH